MKFLKPGLSLALLGTGLAFSPASPSAAAGLTQVAPDPTGVQAMRQDADGNVRVTEESATGKVGFVAARGAKADLLPAIAGNSTAKAAAKTDAYLDEHGAAFGASKGELTRTGITPNRYGWTVSYVQQHQGVEVFASRLKANVDRDGDLTSIAGFAVPDLDLSVEPTYSKAQAADVAVRYVETEPIERHDAPAAAPKGLRAVDQKLVIYRTGALKGDDTGENRLAYVVEVVGDGVRDMVVVDANTRKPLNRWTTVTDALERELYESSPAAADQVWAEGDAFPGELTEDQQNLVNSAGESYWLYANTFGRDSYDGLGAVMKTVNNDPRISCPNANWNGVTTNYCDGVTSDDIVSHEWAHAYTEYTSGLIYQYQSGALNEAYSDVWGETLDLVNGREDEGESFETKRPDGECEPTASPTLEVNILEPEAQAGPCKAAAASFGEGYTTETVTTDVVVATDPSDATGASTTDGCSPFTNAAAVAGSYAYVDRGSCAFQLKVNNAEAAGATGIVIGNNVTGVPFAVAGSADISGIMVSKADGTRFKAAGTSTIEITAEDISTRTDSTRWLVGEKSTAFGGAIRDMWNPTCYGDPGKVSDEEYNCDPNFTDNGGVHGNSGVPNHAYALMVDGGDFNGQSINGMGLDKAANIWWRAQTAYLTPGSDFVDAADALEQSCTDLVGMEINQVSTETDGGQTPATPIVASDCTEVVNTMTAVEMRVEPVVCNFQPLLEAGSPSVCGAGFAERVLFSENFEKGLDRWTPEQELADLPQFGYAGGFGAPWEATDEVPGNHAGTVARGPAPDLGDCSGDGVNDFSSRDSIISPVITMPEGGISPRLTFEHYVATEGGFDGGNMKISIDGGDFEVIPAAAYTFNAPSTLLSLGAQNTNPLAGEDGFTGTDGGQVTGSWGESQVDLTALDIAAGDLVQLRVDIGRDGCGGLADYSAWFVDNIKIVECVIATDITAVRNPDPSTYGEDSTIVATTVDTAATGPVSVTIGDVEVGTAEMKKGEAVVALPRGLNAGSYDAVVSYAGDATHAASSTDLTFVVDKASTRTKVRAPKKVKKGTNPKARVTVISRGLDPQGTVKIKKGKRTVGEGVLEENGKVAISLASLKKAKKHDLTAKYLGAGNYAASTQDFSIRIKK
ncbi:M4 family metallopeptidase [Nocardioides sp.]|uniref:M4 family metallopeptidase n=1 Tax=Nocardioides sp. TaxID=35761 RepID=UPI002B27336D|nr:M4 family metallopeptidase [Nocardioides sp.]